MCSITNSFPVQSTQESPNVIFKIVCKHLIVLVRYLKEYYQDYKIVFGIILPRDYTL